MNRHGFVQKFATVGGLVVAGCVDIGPSDVGSDFDISDSDGPSSGSDEPAEERTPGPERTSTVAPVGPGPYIVGSTNIEMDPGATTPGRNLGDYQLGFREDETKGFVDEVLASPKDVFTFDLEIPDESGLYGIDAGTTLQVVGYLFYPTTHDNERPDYSLGPATVPRMQRQGEAPVFADSVDGFPLLVFSHGRGATPLVPHFVDLARFFATHGYVVCSLFHGDRRFEQLSPTNLDEPQEFTLRPLTVTHTLDELLGGNSGFDAVVDADRIGGFGESYGGTTMTAVTGAELLPFGLLSTETDRRIRASVGQVSFMGSHFFGQQNKGAESVFAPHMTIAGSEDELTDVETYEAVVSAIAVERYLIVVEGQKHTFEPNAWTEARTWAFYFLEAFVRGDQTAIDTMESMGAVEGGVDDTVVVP